MIVKLFKFLLDLFHEEKSVSLDEIFYIALYLEFVNILSF